MAYYNDGWFFLSSNLAQFQIVPAAPYRLGDVRVDVKFTCAGGALGTWEDAAQDWPLDLQESVIKELLAAVVEVLK